MDNIDPKLKDLVLFINQNSQFNIYGVELKYYKKNGSEILAPNLHGAEIKKRVGASSGNSKFLDSTPEEFWSAVEMNKDIETASIKLLADAIQSSVRERLSKKRLFLDEEFNPNKLSFQKTQLD